MHLTMCIERFISSMPFDKRCPEIFILQDAITTDDFIEEACPYITETLLTQQDFCKPHFLWVGKYSIPDNHGCPDYSLHDYAIDFSKPASIEVYPPKTCSEIERGRTIFRNLVRESLEAILIRLADVCNADISNVDLSVPWENWQVIDWQPIVNQKQLEKHMFGNYS